MNNITKEVINFVKENDIKFIRLAFCDVFGIQKNIAIMSDELQNAFENGIAFDGFAIDGFSNEKNNTLLLFPDPTTLSILPWRPSEGRVARFFCDVKYPNGENFESDSRMILTKAVNKAKEMGYTIKVGTECEFYIFKTDDEGQPTLMPYDEAGYFDVSPVDKGENIRREICLTLEEMGITPISSHHERGPGQNRIIFRNSEALLAADDFVTFKWIVKAIANKNGGYATFMPKPLKELSGSGLHLNLLVFKDNENILSKGLEDSKEAKYFIAGIMNRIKEITAILNPTRNSYKRFGEFYAPKSITWSKKNPNTLIKITDYIENRSKVTLRSLDPTANPYLAFALVINAGLEGIKRKEELNENANLKYFTQDAKIEDIDTLADNFSLALGVFENSTFVKECLGENLVYNFVNKRKKDLQIDEDIQELKYFLTE